MNNVWIDWGSGRRDEVDRFDFNSLEELNAFLDGVQTAAARWGIEDFRQFDSLEELAEAGLIEDEE